MSKCDARFLLHYTLLDNNLQLLNRIWKRFIMVNMLEIQSLNMKHFSLQRTHRPDKMFLYLILELWYQP